MNKVGKTRIWVLRRYQKKATQCDAMSVHGGLIYGNLGTHNGYAINSSRPKYTQNTFNIHPNIFPDSSDTHSIDGVVYHMYHHLRALYLCHTRETQCFS